VPMRPFRPLPLALAIALLGLPFGCSGGTGPGWSTKLPMDPAAGGARLSVTAWRGKVRLRNSTTGRIEVQARGSSPLPWEKTVLVRNDPLALVVDERAKDADLDLDIAVPPGATITCACAEADVSATGSWDRLSITTAGAIDARVDAASGLLKSQRGDVALVALGPGPKGEMRAETMSGNVAVTLPAAWNGLLNFQTQTGKLDVPPHGNLSTKWDEAKRNAVGRMGPEHEKGAPALAVVWGVSATGDVSFRIAG
jgi:hypothetical protein